MTGFLKKLSQGLIILDGGMGTLIQDRFPDPGAGFLCNENLNITNSDLILNIHKDYFKAGCDAVETNTFGANRIKLASFGLDEQVLKINHSAAQIARQAADAVRGKKQRFVLGSIGPTGKLPSSEDPDLGGVDTKDLEQIYFEQALALIQGGVDGLIIETCQDIMEARCAIFGSRRAGRGVGRSVPIVVNITVDQNGRMLLGTEVGAAMAILEGLSVDAIGLNCSTGPAEMKDSIRYLGNHCSLPVACVPNAGMPENIEGRAVYSMGPKEFANTIREMVQACGLNIVGGCCGTTPEHIGALAKELKGVQPRILRPRQEPSVASALKRETLKQEIRPLIIGERINAQGSRRAKNLLLKEDYEGILTLAREQASVGAHVLDVCVALTEREDEAEMMEKAVRKLSQGIDTPIMIDTTRTEVVEKALEAYPGRVIINSVNLEKGGERFSKVMPLAKKYGAAVVALTIDDGGMAMTAERKIEVAKKIYERATCEFGISPTSLIFDLLTFTLGTGQERFRKSAIETLKAIRQLKELLPDVFTILGISNCSYGLKPVARRPLNSVFLYHAVEAGLDLAIINPAEIVPYTMIPEVERQLCDDLVYNRDPDSVAKLIDFYEKRPELEEVEKPAIFAVRPTVEEQIKEKILNRSQEGLEQLIDQALNSSSPAKLVNTVLLPAMREVGEAMARGELVLPFVLQSAEVMKKAVSYLEPFMEKEKVYKKGKVALATVFGDVHDIGKNLVKAILTNNGYDVVDLGKEVPVHTILEEVSRGDFAAVGLSALLVSTSQEMGYCVRELAGAGFTVPVIVGGAAINKSFAHRISRQDGGKAYEGGVFYASDAFQGLSIIDQLVDEKGRDSLMELYKKQVELAPEKVDKEEEYEDKAKKIRKAVKPARIIPKPPFFGIKSVTEVGLEEVFDLLDLNSLYRSSWKLKAKNKKAFSELIDREFAPLLKKLKIECRQKHYMQPKAVYGYFPCRAKGDFLVIHDPYSPEKELTRFNLPRQERGKRLCLADYFSQDLEAKDVVALMVCTIGPTLSKVVGDLNNKDQYSKALYLHGLGVQCAEALAEYLHLEIRKELGLPQDQGKRYSPGYSSWMVLKDQKTIFNLLEVEKRLGVNLTANYQMVPEQSVSAMIVHHPGATYFSVGGK